MSEKPITVTFTPAERNALFSAIAYYETVLEDERDGDALPDSHPLVRATHKLREARRG